jgi:hypothetical protein
VDLDTKSWEGGGICLQLRFIYIVIKYFNKLCVKITRMSVEITRRVPKSYAGCQNHTHDVKITLVRVVQ